jgi:pyruvate formate lyase activating enzyme
MKCEKCGKERYAKVIPLCPECIKEDEEVFKELHDGIERLNGGSCNLCSNKCSLEERRGLCGIERELKNSILHAYYDVLPTNCCNSWFCKGPQLRGFNLAIFYYGCNFDCLFCQNWEHKMVESGERKSIEEVLKMLREDVKCLCHFGGSPEPQLPFAIELSKRAIEERDVIICWEWNGAGRKDLVMRASEISYESGGTVKFDLKAWNRNLHRVLTGRDNEAVKKNFKAVAEEFPEVISATTLLVPYYVDEKEIEEIARFISEMDENIPYSLLVFHPDYRLSDLPITPISQVRRCYEVAKKYLKRVHIGNLHLLTTHKL